MSEMHASMTSVMYVASSSKKKTTNIYVGVAGRAKTKSPLPNAVTKTHQNQILWEMGEKVFVWGRLLCDMWVRKIQRQA